MRDKPPDDVLKAVDKALDTGQADDWRVLLRQPAIDGFEVVTRTDTASRLFPKGGADNFTEWVTTIAGWITEVQDPRHVASVESTVLHELWDNFASRLSSNLRRARIEADLPQHGGVLAFVAALSKCIIIRYQYSAQMREPILEPISVIDQPRTAFDVWAAVDRAAPAARNALKAILASGHKLVMHRDVLIHVDRRQEGKVFGPSIDTLLMAEVLAQDVYETEVTSHGSTGRGPRTVLEIGCGNGMLAASMLRHLSSLEELFAVDVEFEALTCTKKNMAIAASSSGSATRAVCRLLSGPFDSSLLNRRFDLVVCNPPYIPEPPGGVTGGAFPDHLNAVGGLDLLLEVVQNAENLLTGSGKLLIMTSSVSINAALKALRLHGRLEVDRPLGESGYEALFDVEAVLERPEWLSFLMRDGNVTERDGAFYHRLHPLWIRRKGES